MSKSFLIAICFMASCFHILGQSQQVLNNFKQANDAFAKADYKLADSLYTLCIDHSRNGDVYFNRAFSRLNLKDTCGYCEDLKMGYVRFRDGDCEENYNKSCFSSRDTVYYNKKNERLDKKRNATYFKETFNQKCTYSRYYYFHNMKPKRTYEIMFDSPSGPVAGFSNTDCFAKAFGNDTAMVFYYIEDFSLNEKIKKQYPKFSDGLPRIISDRHQKIKQFLVDRVLVKIEVNSSGKITEVIVCENQFISKRQAGFRDFEKDVKQLFSDLPALDPVVFLGKPVRYIGYYILEF
ncbi:MAG: hypothetical protein JST26_20735 [Bacteroidetes bacterium]|nr:hypothetical protein [Bacteroidota bacterium]